MKNFSNIFLTFVLQVYLNHMIQINLYVKNMNFLQKEGVKQSVIQQYLTIELGYSLQYHFIQLA
ncbi:hypothetical protein A0H76_1022 [Hepatospora eriocheir]|uniref:Uncharacterized protein n=1 Tax=Hepatospora eriocheir TaxID=1081669 RepID=A0A1X0QHU5_9MICR|nr:hypothetical protein A0H76_1022 [Hepatospora eriocheir]